MNRKARRAAKNSAPLIAFTHRFYPDQIAELNAIVAAGKGDEEMRFMARHLGKTLVGRKRCASCELDAEPIGYVLTTEIQTDDRPPVQASLVICQRCAETKTTDEIGRAFARATEHDVPRFLKARTPPATVH